MYNEHKENNYKYTEEYTVDAKVDFGFDLKRKLLRKEAVLEISAWAFRIYLDDEYHELDDELRNILVTLGTMDAAPEFVLSYEKLHQIADDLMAGKEVKL